MFLAVSGCVSQDFWVRNSVTYDKYERDFVGCQTLATQAVPTNTQVGWVPYGGVYSVDTNSPLRLKNFEICMRDRGYSQQPIPYCSGDALTAADAQARLPVDRNRRMKISANSCYTFGPDGTPYIFSGT